MFSVFMSIHWEAKIRLLNKNQDENVNVNEMINGKEIAGLKNHHLFVVNIEVSLIRFFETNKF